MPEVATKRSKARWTTVAFGDVVRQVKDKVDPEESGLERYVAGEHMDTDDLRIRRWGEIGDGYLGPAFHMRFKPGQVLYGSRRTYLRKVAVADFEGITANTTYVLESSDPKVLLPELLPFIMQTQSFTEHSVRESRGSVNPYVNFSDLAWFEFQLPSREEQLGLLAALQGAEAVLSSTESISNAARKAQAAAFDALVAQHDPIETPLGNILEGSPRNGCSAMASNDATGYWVLALSAISKWGYRGDQLKPVVPTQEMKAARIDKGDLVISRSNTRELVGLPAVFPEDRDDVSYPDTMMRLEIDPAKASTPFLELCLRSMHCRRQIQSFAAGTSASMKKINGTNLKRVTVPLCDRSIQNQIVETLSPFTAQICQSSARYRMASVLKQQMLYRTLDCGEVR